MGKVLSRLAVDEAVQEVRHDGCSGSEARLRVDP